MNLFAYFLRPAEALLYFESVARAFGDSFSFAISKKPSDNDISSKKHEINAITHFRSDEVSAYNSYVALYLFTIIYFKDFQQLCNMLAEMRKVR